MALRLPCCLLLLLLSTLGTLSAAAPARDLRRGADCADIPGIAPVLSAGRILMVGELHGTREMPAEFLRLACNALQRGLAVSVGLEIVDTEGALAAYTLQINVGRITASPPAVPVPPST